MKLCVLLPAKDEELVIARTLTSILNAGILPIDIYLINDGSKDKTGEIAKSFGVNILHNEKNIGKASSIKKVVDRFDLINRYDIIASMDADTVVHIDYYQEVINSFEENDDVAVVCGTAKSSPFNWLTAYRCLSYWISHFVYKDGQSKMGTITVAPGCTTSYRSKVFAQLEWANDTLVEDMDATVQVHRKKLGKIVYAKKAIVYTQDPRTIHDYRKQLYRWHSGAWQVGKKYKLLSPFSLHKLDLEYKLLMIEGLIFASLLVISPIWLITGATPKAVGYAFILDSLVIIGLSAICALFEGRFDVLLYSPLYQPLRFLDCTVFLYSFWRTIVRNKNVKGWFSVKRY